MWIIVAGPAQGVPVSSLPVCLEKMKLSFRDVHSVLEGALTSCTCIVRGWSARLQIYSVIIEVY